MSFPFFQFMYPSMVNFDMSRGTPEGMLNTFGNFMISDLQARNWLYMTPIFNFNGVFQYPQLGGNFQLPNTVNNGSLFDFNPPQINTQNPFGFFNPILGNNNSSDGANNNTKVTTPEDQKKKDNVKKLVDTLKNIMKNTTLRDSVKSKVEYAINHYRDNKASLDDQLKTLKDAYKAIPSSVIEKYLIKSSIGNEDVSDLLKRAGYENAKTRDKVLTSSKLKEFKDGIENITDSSDDNQSTDLTSSAKNGQIDILDLISAWNNLYPNDNLVELLGNKYNENIGINKDAVYRRLSDVVGALLDEADKVVNTEVDDELMLDESTIETIKTLKENLSKALTKNNDKVSTSEIKDAFNKLYATLRTAEATIVQEKINRNYEFLGNDCGFAKDFIIKATEKDLQDENLEGVGTEVTLNEVEQEEEEEEDNDNLTPEQLAARAVASTTRTLDSMTAYLVKNADGTYTEKRPEGDDTTPRVFEVNAEGDLVVKGTNRTVTPEQIKKEINNAETKIQKEKESKSNAVSDARYIVSKLDNKNSKERHYSEITDRLSNVNKDNVLYFLDEYYKQEDNKGLVSYLDKNLNNDANGMSCKKNVIKALLAKAKEAGLENTEEYQIIKDIMEVYDSTDYKDKTNFKNKADVNTRSTGKAIGAIAGGAAVGAGTATAVGGTLAAGLASEGIMAATIAGMTGTAVATTTATVGLGAAIAATPVGWIVGGALVLGAAGYGIYRLCTNGTKDQEVLDECIKSLYEKMNKKLSFEA